MHAVGVLLIGLFAGAACQQFTPMAPSASSAGLFQFPVIWTYPDPNECAGMTDAGKAFFDADDGTLWVCDGFRQSGWRGIDSTHTYHTGELRR